MSDSLADATRRVVATHLSMYKDSCVVSAVEAWRMWNEFPEQRRSLEFHDVLGHFGANTDAVLADISFVMGRLMVSPTGMFDDALLLQLVATDQRTGAHGSRFLKMCVYSVLISKFGYDVQHSSYAHALQQMTSYMSRCSVCEGTRFIQDLYAYVARRRLSSL